MTLKTINFRKKLNLESQQEREVKIMIILLSVFFSAIIFGISLTNQNKEFFISIFNNIYYDTKSFTVVLFNSFIINILLLIIIFVSGFSSIGIPSIIFSIVLKGFGIGSCCAYYVSEFGMSGIGMYLLTAFPSNIIYAVALLFSSDFSILQSVDILSLIYEKNQNNILLRKYIYKNIIISLIILLGSISESFFIIIFGNLLS